MSCGWRWENKTWGWLALQVLTVPLSPVESSCQGGPLASGSRNSGLFLLTNELNPGWIGGVVGLT